MALSVQQKLNHQDTWQTMQRYFFFQGIRDKMFWIDGSPSGGRRGNCGTRGARLWHQQLRFCYEQLPKR